MLLANDIGGIFVQLERKRHWYHNAFAGTVIYDELRSHGGRNSTEADVLWLESDDDILSRDGGQHLRLGRPPIAEGRSCAAAPL